MKKEKTPFNFFYSGHSLVEYPEWNKKRPPENNEVCKGDDGLDQYRGVTIYPGNLFEFADFTGKA